MATVIHIETFQIKPSVNTPDYTKPGKIHYDNGNWRESHKLPELPTRDKTYWKWNGAAVVEMTTEEKAVVDYVPPPPEPTPEELTRRAEEERWQKIDTGIKEIYPRRSDEFQEIRMILAEEFPNNERAQTYNAKIEAVLSKYPKE